MSAELDTAIDGAVREMLDVEPRADLRARVTAELAAPRFNPAASAFRWNRVVFAAAAALVFFAVFVARRGAPIAPQPPSFARGADQYLPADGPRLASNANVSAHQPPRRQPRAARPADAPARDVVSAANEDSASVEIAPLKTIAPISIAPIAHDSIAPADIAMRPLNQITDVQIAPLTPPDRRN